MTDKEKKSKIADILMDFQEEYSNEVINRPMLASIYAGNILSFIDSLQEEPVSNEIEVSYDAKINEAHRLGREEGMFLAKTMFKEPVSDDFEEASKDYAENHNMDFVEDDDDCYWSARYAFKAGAQWQKQQIMKDAVDGEVTYGKSLAIPSLGYRLDKEGLDFGDKVKLIIIKEE